LHKGLGWLQGECVKLRSPDLNLRLPHMGWNDVTILNEGSLFSQVGETPCFYFCHSYQVVTDDAEILATCDYGTTFICSVACNNIYGVQFHPEKSFDEGFEVLKNFCSFN